MSKLKQKRNWRLKGRLYGFIPPKPLQKLFYMLFFESPIQNGVFVMKIKTAHPGEDEVYIRDNGSSFRITQNNTYIAYPTVSQFVGIFQKLTGVRLWPWQNNLNSILNTWCNIAINNQSPGCSFRVDLSGDIYAYYLSPSMIEIRLWRDESEYFIEIAVPYDSREGFFYDSMLKILEQ